MACTLPGELPGPTTHTCAILHKREENHDVQKSSRVAAAIATTVAMFGAPNAQAQQLNLLCNAAIDWCELMKNKFEAETGIKTNMTRRSSGESYAQVRAESANPKIDVWWAGTR